MKTIEIKPALLFGWDTLRDNFVLYLKLLVVMIIMVAIPGAIVGKLALLMRGLMSLPLYFLNVIWQLIIGMGALKICLKLYDRQPVEIQDLWSCIPMTLDFFVVKFLYTLIVTVGLFLLVVPGLIWSMQFYLASYLVVDRGNGAIAALKGSSAITRGAKWDLGVFISVVLLMNIVGLIFLGVGLLITLPISMLAGVQVYRKLLAQTDAGGVL